MSYLLHHLLSEAAAKYPEKEAIIFKENKVSYANLDKETNRLANSLTVLGIKRGDRVGIYINRSIASITSVFGILKTGAAYVPIDPLCPPHRLAYIINKCEIKCLLSTKEKLATVEQSFPDNCPLERIVLMDGYDSCAKPAGRTKVDLWQEIRKSAREDEPRQNTIDADVAYILFTSGSTGNPKGVVLTHRNSLTFVNAAHDFFKTKNTDRFSNICPLHFDMSVFDIFVAIRAGAALVIIPETTAIFPVRLAETIEKYGITVWNSVPTALTLLATYKNFEMHDLSALRLILFAGEVFPMKYLRRLQEALPHARFCNMYGQTEANSSTYYWVKPVLPDGGKPLPIGRSLPNFEVFSLDENGNEIDEPGREGELYVRSSSVASGYWGEAERTKSSFVQNPLRTDVHEIVYRTGDLVFVDHDGNYVFLGRKDHMIKSRGHRIEIGEIESVLCSHPQIKNAVVIPISDELIGYRITATIVPFIQGKLSKEEVLEYCSRSLPRYMIPEAIAFSDSLPMTSSGKIDRSKLFPQKQ